MLFEDFVSTFPKLRELPADMDVCIGRRLSPANVVSSSPSLSLSLSSLTTLDTKMCDRLQYVFSPDILPNITKLHLSGWCQRFGHNNVLVGVPLQELGIFSLQTLTELKIIVRCVFKEKEAATVRAFGNLKKLRKLTLMGSSFNKSSSLYKAFSNALGETSLQELNLRPREVLDAEFVLSLRSFFSGLVWPRGTRSQLQFLHVNFGSQQSHVTEDPVSILYPVRTAMQDALAMSSTYVPRMLRGVVPRKNIPLSWVFEVKTNSQRQLLVS